MRNFSKKHTIWSLGMREEQCATVRSMAGSEYTLQTWPENEMPDFSSTGEASMPCLICFSMEAARQYVNLPVERVGHLDLIPKMLLLDENADLAAMEEALDFGMTDIIRLPLTRERFSSCLRRATEAAALHKDMQNMAREIFVERELLERKNEALSFLVEFLSKTSESFDETEIMRKAFVALQKLFPVMTMHGAIFSRDDTGNISAELYVAAPKADKTHAVWRELLLETSASMYRGVEIIPTTSYLPLTGAKTLAMPQDGHIMTLPLALSEDVTFFLVLLTPLERHLGRDQAFALDSALRHMALSLRNARRYREVCHFADNDALTGLSNRRTGETALKAEVSRHRRYEQDMSVLLLDIDHFKSVNDTWGHMIGDDVLRGVATVIRNTLRQADHCYRYGGEEFVIILPHTSNSNAVWLAERLRRKIEKLVFTAQGKPFSITASIGVASMPAGETKEAGELTSEADIALYRAKNEGRNRVIAHTLITERISKSALM